MKKYSYKQKYNKFKNKSTKKNFYKNKYGGEPQNFKNLSLQDGIDYNYTIKVEEPGKRSILKKIYGKFYGPWKYGQPYLKGKHILDNGSIYEGQWVNGKPDGEGIWKFKSGNEYKGSLKNGNLDGNGEFIFASGDKYIGQFKNGKIQGEGTKFFREGHKYKGHFVNGDMSGKGIYYFQNGDIYEGEFSNNKRNGFGIMQYANNDDAVYEGNWVDGIKQGEGILTTKDFKFSGTWNYNYPKQGKNEFFKTGVVLEGDFEFQIKHGFLLVYVEGTAYYPDGSRYTGLFVDYQKAHGKSNDPGNPNLLANKDSFNIQYGFSENYNPSGITDAPFL